MPSNDEWEALVTAVGGVSTAGTKLKATSGWNSNGTDDYGFSALPGGLGYYGYWWSTSEHHSSNDYYMYMIYDDEYVYWFHGAKSRLQSVRCLQD